MKLDQIVKLVITSGVKTGRSLSYDDGVSFKWVISVSEPIMQ